MDAKLLGKLARAEEDVVSAMLSGDGDLAAYEFAWTSLLDEISQASTSGDINNTTLAVADNVVARVSTLVDCCLSLSSAPPPALPILDLSTRSPFPLHTTSSFIPEAYTWLLKNIANPYPSSEFKASLAQRHNLPVSAVTSWFANTRRQMGWTALCRDFFRNCRADALDAAYRVLVKEDPDHRLCPEIIHAFVAMKVAAEELYASSVRSSLADDLDTVVKDMLAEDEALARRGSHGGTGRVEYLRVSGECTRNQSACTSDIRSQSNPATQILCPSFDLSHSSSPVLGLDDYLLGESEDGDTSPPLLAGHERYLPLSELVHAASSGVPARPMKRRRLSLSPNPCLQSPSTSAEGSLENDSQDQTWYSVREQSSTYIAESRKRRLSDSHLTGMPNFPSDSTAGSHLHTVPDPLPLSAVGSDHSIDEWFKANFDALFALPPPADVVEPDIATQWEVELFSNYILPENPQEATPFVQDNRISTSTDLATLDDLLQSLENGSFVLPPEIMHPSTMAPVSDHVPQGIPLLPNLSQAIDWTTPLSDSSRDPMFSQSCATSALPEIDFSILQFPHMVAL